MENEYEVFESRMLLKFREKLKALGSQRLLRLEEMEDAVETVKQEMSAELMEGLLNLKKTAKPKASR
jgi:hypothetical protein